MSKSRTTPFSSAKSASSFAKTVGGKVTTQSVGHSKEVHHVHYKSDGVYRGSKSNDNDPSDFDSDINGNGTNWHTSDDL